MIALAPAAVAALMAACAPGVAPETMSALIRVESGYDPSAINDITARQRVVTDSLDAAVGASIALTAAGHRLALGLGQVTSENVAAAGLTVDQALDPCANVRLAGRILASFYQRFVKTEGPGQPALKMALSAYNTGGAVAGVTNGYVARVQAAEQIVPSAVPALEAPSAPQPVDPPEQWDVFGDLSRQPVAGPVPPPTGKPSDTASQAPVVLRRAQPVSPPQPGPVGPPSKGPPGPPTNDQPQESK